MDTKVVLITLVIYKLVLITIGLWAQRRTKSQEDFFLGGRALGPVVASISYAASAASAWTLLGMSGAAYMLGLSALWIALGVVIGCAINWWWLAPRMMRYSHRHRVLTLTEFLVHTATPDRNPFRPLTVRVASLILLVSFLFYIASQFQGAGNTFATTFDLGMADSILLGGLIIMIYTLLGGFWAVSLTDTLQGLLMVTAAILLPLSALLAVGGFEGFGAGLARFSSADQLSWTGRHTGLLAIGIVVGSLATGTGTFGQPHLLTRFMALRDERAWRQARLLAVGWYATVFAGMCFLGLAGRVLVPAIDNPETIFIHLTSELFPPLVSAIVLAAVLSAIMSTADSMLLVAASAVSYDLGLSKVFPNRRLLISRLAIGVLCLLAIVVAIALPASIFDRVLFAWIAIGAAFGPPVFFRLAGVEVKPGAVFAAMLTGFTLAVVFYLLPNTPGDIAERLLPFCAGLLVLWFGRQTPGMKPAVTDNLVSTK
ncbi:sodium/proline symporter [Exilibacterium tricleocarpae]|uniref:Sodium/proline symporter n=1 Tax=Exilibacterium tricleocarpae TaxID=2591008 RepID=A0A545U5C3_9GAMM|nr:sodium/proline symporter [Exilibacterium tricleocarpae]TQV84670.1 sodium/proline symporter [Exilibacterium tricleocarpae]